MNKFAQKVFLLSALFFTVKLISAQEALKSVEEEYYDFLSLQGITQRPTLNYRTLSDSVWNIGTVTNTVADEDDDEQVVEEPFDHPWKNNNLGKRRTLWQPRELSENGYLRGTPQGVFLKIYGPDWFNSFNSGVPYGQNDGALWQGRGYNTSLSGGARLEAYGVELTLKPQVSFSQNMDFKILPGVYGSEYSYFWKGNVDLPQRFGDKPFWTFDWGDTEVRYSWHTLTIGFGTQAIWLGPAWLNPMLGSNNAPTFPKFDIGLRRQRIVIPKVNWYLGDIEGRIWIGRLEESDYFDNNPDNDYRQLTGFSVAYSPSFLPGFTIGMTKICINDWRHKSMKYLNPFYSTNGSQVGDKIDEDQKMSIFVDWIFPKVGFEVYGELGKDDYNGRGSSNPFHTAVYTVGAKKSLMISKKHNVYAEIIFEWSNFEMSQDFQLQWKYMGYYSHGSVVQGYTQKGQILGAGSGYFGDSQFLGIKVYYPRGNAMLFTHRSRPDNNYIHNLGLDTSSETWRSDGLVEHPQWACFKACKVYGITALYHITNSFQVSGEIDYVKIVTPYYERKDAQIDGVHLTLGAKYNF